MSKLILFDAIDARLVSEVSSVTLVQLWNNQVANEDQEEARPSPMVYIEMSSIEWVELEMGYQQGEVTITVRVVVEKYATDDRTFLTLVDEVYAALQLYTTDDFSPIKRISERQDSDHENLIVWEADYTTVLVDVQAYTERDFTTVTGTALEITGDLDIDNEIIRTGDGTY